MRGLRGLVERTADVQGAVKGFQRPQTHIKDLDSGIACAPAFPKRRGVEFEQSAVADSVANIALDPPPYIWEVPEVGGRVVEAAEVEVAHDLGLEAVEEGVLIVKVGAEELVESLLLFVFSTECSQHFIEPLLVEVEGNLPTMVHAADEVLNRVAVTLEELLQLLQPFLVDEFGFQADEDGDALLVQLAQAMSLDEVGVKGGG